MPGLSDARRKPNHIEDPNTFAQEVLTPPPGFEWLCKEQPPMHKPYFTTSEVGKCFLGWSMRNTQTLLHQDPVMSAIATDLGIKVGKNGRRNVQLWQVERLLHAAFEYNKIDTDTFLHAMATVKHMAGMWGRLNE